MLDGRCSMGKVKVVREPRQSDLDTLKVKSWSIWTKEVSEFPWSHGEPETCYFLEGAVVVIPEGGEPLKIGKGDLVTFPKGMQCTWRGIKPVKKHYRSG